MENTDTISTVGMIETDSNASSIEIANRLSQPQELETRIACVNNYCQTAKMLIISKSYIILSVNMIIGISDREFFLIRIIVL